MGRCHIDFNAEVLCDVNGAGFHNLGPQKCHFFHFFPGDFLQLAGRRIEAGIHPVDAADVGVDLAAAAQLGRQGHGRGIGAAPAQGGNITGFVVALEAGHDDHVAGGELPFHGSGINVQNLGFGMQAFRQDSGLKARQRDGRRAQLLEDHG